MLSLVFLIVLGRAEVRPGLHLYRSPLSATAASSRVDLADLPSAFTIRGLDGANVFLIQTRSIFRPSEWTLVSSHGLRKDHGRESIRIHQAFVVRANGVRRVVFEIRYPGSTTLSSRFQLMEAELLKGHAMESGPRLLRLTPLAFDLDRLKPNFQFSVGERFTKYRGHVHLTEVTRRYPPETLLSAMSPDRFERPLVLDVPDYFRLRDFVELHELRVNCVSDLEGAAR